MLLPAEIWLAVALRAETLGTLTLPELCGICIHHNSQSLVDIMTEHSPWFQKCKRLSIFWLFTKIEQITMHSFTTTVRSWREWWKLVTAIHHEHDSLVLCEQHSQGDDCAYSCPICFHSAGTENIFGWLPYVFLWSSLCNYIDVFASTRAGNFPHNCQLGVHCN